MATAGDELVNAFTGLRTVFRKTNGELLQVDRIGSRQDPRDRINFIRVTRSV